MITSSRIGRYGNTCNAMFQFAAVLAMSKKTGLNYAIPKSETYYEPNYGCMNTSIWDGFDLDVLELTSLEANLKEVDFPFEYTDMLVEDNTDMVGFFQSEKYFEDFKHEVGKQFTFKTEVKIDVDNKIKNGHYPDPLTSTSIHLRLGDYTHKREYHPAQSAEYYQSASKLSGLENYIIFSDDVVTAKQMLGTSSNVYYSEEQNPFSALYHMSLCSNHIICNSTFGWWGAWLGEMKNPQQDKTIIAPKLWFGPAHDLSSEDIIPDRWVKL